YELLPYLYSLFDESSASGAPILRPLVYEFQDDEAAQTVADEAMLGPSLLVAPVVSAKDALGGRTVVLPKGRWFEVHSGAALEGGRTVTVSAAPDALPADALPMFVRDGAIIPRADVGSNVASARGGALYLDAFPGAAADAQSSFTLREDDGGAKGAPSRITFRLARTASGARLSASAREGGFAAAHARVVVRVRRVDHDPTAVTLDGVALIRAPSAAALTAGAFAWDANDRAVVVALADRFPFSLDLAFDPALASDGEVDVPIRVKVPAGTPSTTAIHVASSRAGWVHAPLARTGDEATGTLRIPRGAYTSFKISRGDWPTVEKGEACAEVGNRRALGAATRPIVVRVTSWADRCP
ncbi:MAG TPA: hypothetical protein VLT33_17830, partial [Labilithrix sp.]|nr:hypothetical protein [Labilithrix sp.]